MRPSRLYQHLNLFFFFCFTLIFLTVIQPTGFVYINKMQEKQSELVTFHVNFWKGDPLWTGSWCLLKPFQVPGRAGSVATHQIVVVNLKELTLQLEDRVIINPWKDIFAFVMAIVADSQSPILAEVLLCTRHWPKCLCALTLNFQTSPLRLALLLYPFYRWGTGRTEMSCHLPKVTQKQGFKPVCSQAQAPDHYSTLLLLRLFWD